MSSLSDALPMLLWVVIIIVAVVGKMRDSTDLVPVFLSVAIIAMAMAGIDLPTIIKYLCQLVIISLGFILLTHVYEYFRKMLESSLRQLENLFIGRNIK